MSTPTRWPLHPPPGELESLSSWVARLATLYRMPVSELVGPNLGVLTQIPDRLDEHAPAELLAALAAATAVPVARLKAMTLPGWVPWLFDSYPMPTHEGEDTFYSYVRGDSVLLAPGEARRYQVARRRVWRGPWIPETPLDRSCPLCTAGPQSQRCWVWSLPLTTGCTIHRRRLLYRGELLTAELAGVDVAGIPVTEPVATLENYTHQALTTGKVGLPGRRVHAGVWFRMLRTLLDELSLPASGLSAGSARALTQVWQTAGLTPRAGIRIWTPYEQLPWSRQETCSPRPPSRSTSPPGAAFGRAAPSRRPCSFRASNRSTPATTLAAHTTARPPGSSILAAWTAAPITARCSTNSPARCAPIPIPPAGC